MLKAQDHFPQRWDGDHVGQAVSEVRVRNIGLYGARYVVLWRGEWHYDYDAGGRVKLVEQQLGTLEKPLPITRMSTDLHTQLIDLAAKWLAVKQAVVITDMSHGLGETADTIGWTCGFPRWWSAKTSRAGFLGDKHKPWRRDPSRGMGTYRYHAACRLD